MGEASETEMSGCSAAAARVAELAANLAGVRTRINDVVRVAGRKNPVRLVAVSKFKPATDIEALHTGPSRQVHFGENYVAELVDKAATLPRSIRWHFIGTLQSNKAKGLAESVPNLWCVESVDSVKKADKLDAGWAKWLDNDGKGTDEGTKEGEEEEEKDRRLRVMVQVNTSGEEAKSGCEPGAETVELCRHIRQQCRHLRLHGLMTIGAIGRSMAATGPEGQENDDFAALVEVRDRVVPELGLGEGEDDDRLELSMGMSADFETAVKMGSDEVRVGSTIFGSRPPPVKAGDM